MNLILIATLLLWANVAYCVVGDLNKDGVSSISIDLDWDWDKNWDSDADDDGLRLPTFSEP